MANPVCQINGTTVNLHSFNISSSQDNQDRVTAEFDSAKNVGKPVPDIDGILTIVDEASFGIFGGPVKDTSLGGHGDSRSFTRLRINARNYSDVTTRFPITIAIPAGNLKAAITAVLVRINPDLPVLHRLILSGSQANGPALPDLNYVDTTAESIFDDFTARTGWIRTYYSNAQILFSTIGSISAPWNISDADHNAVNEMTVAKTRVDYANRVKVKYWWPGIAAYAFFRITGTINDGEQAVVGGRTYTFKTAITASAGDVLIGASANATIGNLINAINLGPGSGTAYSAATLVNPQVGADYLNSTALQARALTVGLSGNSIACTTTCANADWYHEGGAATATLKGGYDAGVGNEVVVDNAAEQALYGVYSTTYEAANVTDAATAINLGTSILATSIVAQRTVMYTTYRSGLWPGMIQTIQRANRGMNDSCLITAVNTSYREGQILERTVTAVTGSVFKGDKWRDQYKKWSGGGSSTQVSASSAGGSSGGSSAVTPVYFLGGSPTVYVQSATPTWVPADGSPSGDSGTEYVIDTAARGSLVGTVTVRLRARSGTVTARLWDLDAGVAVGTSTSYTGTSFGTRTFAVTLTSGAHRYQLQLLPGTANVDVNGVGYLV